MFVAWRHLTAAILIAVAIDRHLVAQTEQIASLPGTAESSDSPVFVSSENEREDAPAGTSPASGSGGNIFSEFQPTDLSWPSTSVGQGKHRVEPGRHVLEYRGSGIFGPHNYEEGDRWLDWGIVVQGEYQNNDPTEGQTTEEIFFRRLRPTIVGGNGDWQGILQMDFGAGANGTSSATTVKWANFQYTGLYQAHLTFGSFKPWFSRELVTSGPHLQTIERSFVGNTDYGNPDYMLGVSFDKLSEDRKFAYYTSAGFQDHEQSVTQMQMRSPANVSPGPNTGMLVTGRFDYYLFGKMPYDPRPLHTPAQIVYNRGDFHTDAWRMVVSTAMFGWWNNDDSNPYTVNGVSTSTTQADLNQSYGTEVSSGLRGFGISADVEYQYIRGDLVDPNFTGGLYRNGSTDMNKFSVNGGYMCPRDIELVGAWSVVDATGFQQGLQETTIGTNFYVKKYAIRFSGNYSFVNSMNGTPGNDIGVTRLLSQFVW